MKLSQGHWTFLGPRLEERKFCLRSTEQWKYTTDKMVHRFEEIGHFVFFLATLVWIFQLPLNELLFWVMYWWFETSMFFQFWWRCKNPCVFEVRRCYLINLFSEFLLAPTVSKSNWSIPLSNRLRLSDFWSWSESPTVSNSCFHSFPFIGIPEFEEICSPSGHAPPSTASRSPSEGLPSQSPLGLVFTWRSTFKPDRKNVTKMGAEENIEQTKKMFPFALHLVRMSVSKLILSNNQSRATVWVIDLCLIVGLRRYIISLTTVLSTNVQLRLSSRRMCVNGRLWSEAPDVASSVAPISFAITSVVSLAVVVLASVFTFNLARVFPTSYARSWWFLWIPYLGVDEINSPQFSTVFKMDLFIRPLLLLLQLGVLSHCLPELWPWMIWPGCQLFSFFWWENTEETSSVKSHALTIRTGLRLSRTPVVPQHLLRGKNHITSAWRGATVEKWHSKNEDKGFRLGTGVCQRGKNWAVSVLHRPPTSAASTTKRTRPPSPESSG